MALNVVPFPYQNVGDVPVGLRRLADDIEAGKYLDAHLCGWVIDCGDGRVEIGLLGQTAEPGAVGYYLFGLAQRKLEQI